MAVVNIIKDPITNLADYWNEVNGLMTWQEKEKLEGITEGATANEGTVTSVATGAGLTGGEITTSGTIKANLKSETKLNNNASTGIEASDRVFPVALDKSGYLAVNAPYGKIVRGNITDYDSSAYCINSDLSTAPEHKDDILVLHVEQNINAVGDLNGLSVRIGESYISLAEYGGFGTYVTPIFNLNLNKGDIVLISNIVKKSSTIYEGNIIDIIRDSSFRLSQTLTAGSTSLTFTDNRITNDSIINIYYDVNHLDMVWDTFTQNSNTSFTVTYEPQTTDVTVIALITNPE